MIFSMSGKGLARAKVGIDVIDLLANPFVISAKIQETINL
jgi:hypothetical protein